MEPALLQDFIAVYDDAMPKSMSEQLCRFFDASPHQRQGTTGYGVDLKKKHSIDITLNDHEDCFPVAESLMQHTYPFIRDYFLRHYFLLIGAMSPSVTDPETDQLVSLNEGNWQRYGPANTDTLIAKMYRYGRINLQRYPAQVGGYPHWHSEIFPKDAQGETLHRALLFMYYLNDVAEGGETEFYYQNRQIKPKAGRLVIAPAGFTHTHRGCVPLSNAKYIATSWILFQRAEDLYGQSV